MLKSLFTMFRNDATGTLHNCRIAYDLRYKQFQKQGYVEAESHNMGLVQMAHNFFAACKKEPSVAKKANLDSSNPVSLAIQIFPFAYTAHPLQGKEACAHYLAWLRHGLQLEIDEELIHIAVRRGLNQLAGDDQHEKLREAIAACPAWLVFATEWSEKVKNL